MSLSDGQSRHVDTRGLHILAYDWAPDGKTFLLTVADKAFGDEEQLRPHLLTLGVSGGAAKPYCETVGKLMQATWSPDGHSLAFLGTSEGMTDPYPGGLFLCDGIGSKPRNVIADAGFTPSETGFCPAGKSWSR